MPAPVIARSAQAILLGTGPGRCTTTDTAVGPAGKSATVRPLAIPAALAVIGPGQISLGGVTGPLGSCL